MGIQHNAGKIFDLIFKLYIRKESITPRKILEITKMPGEDIDRAIKYLKALGIIDITLTFGNYKNLQNFVFIGIPPRGINIVEDDKKFFEVFNIGKKSISWKL